MGLNTTAQTRQRGDRASARSVRARALLVLLATGTLTWAMPLAGLMLAGQPVAPYLDFPPLTEAVSHAAFSWPVFVATALSAVAAFGILAIAIARNPRRPVAPAIRGRLPWWGKLGIALMAMGWLFAWTEGLLPSELRRHTFTVIWLGYVLALNALVLRRTGECPLTHGGRWFLALFPVSAMFWWLFEHLNQFTDNWYYIGIGRPGRGAYIAQGSLAFATVLPAIATTRAWLATHLEFRAMRPVAAHPATAWLALVAGAAALLGIGLWPERLYPALWVAPLAIACALQFLLLRCSSLAPLAGGDWRPLLEPAAAALLCGLLWELWNYGSLARWQYSIPYVQRFHVFEMPLVGYAGYLPFGVLCAVVIDLVKTSVQPREPDRLRRRRRSPEP